MPKNILDESEIMQNEIFKKIKEYQNINIVRHIGVDPDALASQVGLRDSIRRTFPEKNVLATGNGSPRFNYFPKLDKYEEMDNALLIVVDTPDKKRIDCPDIDIYKEVIKIDHHPLIDNFDGLEYIDTSASSASELVLDLIKTTDLVLDQDIAEILFMGIVADTNRFLYSTTSKTFSIISDLLNKYELNISRLYSNIYMRPLNEIRLQGYISQNLKVSENGMAYIYISNDILNQFGVDSGAAGNMVNMYNNIEEVILWLTISEDVRNGLFKFNIRSRGPIINEIAEKYNGGGHKFAAGARVKTSEEVDMLIADLEQVCKAYREGESHESN